MKQKAADTTMERAAEEPSPYFHNDLPIEQIVQDELGRSEFARSLSKALANRPKDGSLVVGLTGKWGEGKTSLVNLILRYFESEHTNVVVMHFPVWSLTSRDAIHDDFFAIIKNAVRNSSSRENARKNVARLELLASRMQVIDASIPIIVALLVGSGAFLTSWLSNTFGNATSAIASILIAGLSYVASKFKLISKVVEKMAEFRKKQAAIRRENLEIVKKELHADLERSDKTIVVIIDDLDRLVPEEVKLVLQLLKGTGDLPNLIYILPYDEMLLAKSIESALPNTKDHGLDYLDKIVQVRFRVPPPDVHKVREILTNRLNELIGPTIDTQAEAERWGQLSYAGALRPFRTLRDVYRFLNSFKLSLSQFRTDEQFSVNRTDLLVLEIIKHFEPAVHASIQVMKREIMGGPSRDFKGLMDGKKTIIDKLTDLSLEPNKEVIGSLLKILFPQQGQIIGQDKLVEFYRSFRVAHPDMFDRYFTLLVPEGQILPAEQAALMASRDQSKKLSAIYHEIIAGGRLNALMDHLFAYSEDLAELSPSEFLRSLFQIEGDLPNSRGGAFSMDPEDSIVAVAMRLLKKRSIIDRVHIFQEALKSEEGLSIPVLLILRITDDRSDFFIDPAGRDMEEDEKKKLILDLREAALHYIETASHSDALMNNPNLITLLYKWQGWGSGNGFASWLGEALLSKDKALRVLESCEYEQRAMGVTPGVPSTTIKRKVHQYQDIIAIAKSAGSLDLLKKVPALIESEDATRAGILRDFLVGNAPEE